MKVKAKGSEKLILRNWGVKIYLISVVHLSISLMRISNFIYY